MPSLFDVTSLGRMELPNRFVRSATWEGMAGDDGSVTDSIIDMYAGLAEGGVGLIVTGHAYVSKEGQASPWQLGGHDDSMVSGLARLTDAVHRRGGKIAIQLAHAGCRGAVNLTGIEPIGPSAMRGDQGQMCRGMETDDLPRVAADFARAAGRAEKAGFDAVQIHAAHSYLISEFLSPCHNRRTDGYGGAVQNRARFLLEIVGAIRKVASPGLPVIVKINSDDFIDGGFSVPEMIEVSKLLEEAKTDAIELSGGSPFSPRFMAHRPGPIRSEADEVYYRDAAMLFKSAVTVPLILPGGIRSYSVAKELVERGVTDYVSLSRPLIREPGLINRWKAGDTRKATCVTDNQCLVPLRSGQGLYCVVERKGAGEKPDEKGSGDQNGDREQCCPRGFHTRHPRLHEKRRELCGVISGAMRLYIFESAQIYFADRSVMTPGKGHDPITIPDIFFLIVHPQGLVLFDTGLNVDIWPPEAKEGITQRPDQMVDRQLAKLGYAPGDIKYVIMSHLHSDHAGGMNLFPHATFIVRKSELQAAWWPERFQWAYRLEDYKDTRAFNFIELDDHEDFDLFLDGSVVCIDTKGHTQGHQSLMVRLPNSGTFVLPADAADMQEILDEGLVPGVVWNAEAALLAVRRVQHLQREGAFVVTGHDPDRFRTLKLVPDYYD